MQFDKVAHDGQTQAESAMLSGCSRFRLSKTIEDIWQKVRVNTFPGVAHADFDVRIDPFEPDLDSAAAWRELDRIRKKIPDDLL